MNVNKMLRRKRIMQVLMLMTTLSLYLLLFTRSAIAQSPPAQKAEITLDIPTGGTVWAIIIGINDYGDANDNLNGGPVNGAKMISSMLTTIYGWPNDHIRLLLDEVENFGDTITKTEIEEALTWLDEQENSNDKVLFYYSGHGARNNLGDEYVVPHGARYYSEAISDNSLAQMLNQLESNRTIIILDTCYSGGFAWDGPTEGDLAKDGRIVIASCTEDDPSYEIRFPLENEWKQLFTTHLARDLSVNSRTTVEQAFKQAKEETEKTASLYNVQQHPQIYDGINMSLPEDVNGDGAVDMIDLTIVAVNYGSKQTEESAVGPVDIDWNGVIDIRDITLVATKFDHRL